SPVHDQQATIADRLNEGDEDETFDEEYDETAELVDGDELPPSVLSPETEASPEPKLVTLPTAVVQPRRQPKPRSAPGSKGKAAFTLRLDPERHLKLRLACAVTGRSAQLIVTDALD